MNFLEIMNDPNIKIITLCGSTKFKDFFEKANNFFTLNGKIILSPGVYVHCTDEIITVEQKISLDKLHKEKIDISDAIYVINIDNYIGESTNNEIKYALDNNKKTFYACYK